FGAPDLAHLVARKGGKEADPKAGRSRYFAAQHRHQPGVLDAPLHLDHHLDFLFELLVLGREDAHAGYPELALQGLFDRRAGDLLAEDVDDVGNPSLQSEPPVRAEYAEVTRIEEPVAEEGARRRLVVKVPGYPLAGVDAQQAGLPRRQNPALFIHHLDFSRGYQPMHAQILRALYQSKR